MNPNCVCQVVGDCVTSTSPTRSSNPKELKFTPVSESAMKVAMSKSFQVYGARGMRHAAGAAGPVAALKCGVGGFRGSVQRKSVAPGEGPDERATEILVAGAVTARAV